MKFGKVFVRTACIYAVITFGIIWGSYAACRAAGHAHGEFSLILPLMMSGIVLAQLLAAFLVAGIAWLRWTLRAPDVVITITDAPQPLAAKFHEQDARLERRERLKGELFRLNGEIETFNANLTSDERKAWTRRPGPYGK